jgi:hypothetical protein
MDNIQPILAGLCEYQLEIQFITEVLLLYQYRRSLDPEQLLPKGIVLLKHVSNPLLECEFLLLFETFPFISYNCH